MPSISWISRIVADAEFSGLHGCSAIGGYGALVSVNFSVKNWDMDKPAPQVELADAPIKTISGNGNRLVGFAVPETVIPFTPGPYAQSIGTLYQLVLSNAAIEELERIRNGGDIALTLGLRGVITYAGEAQRIHDDVTCRINQSEWLKFLDVCGYGPTLLFEIPLPLAAAVPVTNAQKELSRARQHLLQGHYQEVVAACRLVLESLTEQLQEGEELEAAKKLRGEGRNAMTTLQRELMIRQAAINYAHVAHHPNGSTDPLFDRSNAVMLLGIAASLVANGLRRSGPV
ncbi:MAG: hypothetical protein EKK46_13445 [Rhodocyclaceae bacterium]|nr:MAG: hypothetical protein EKK46_13445 [Rhodocyclaceae bacterium]